jgi:uncharacterized membrane protein YfcA
MVALALNLVVASGGALQFARAGHLRLRAFVPLALTAAPTAFLSAQMPVDRETFRLLLGGLLLLAGAWMIAVRWVPPSDEAPRIVPWPAMAALGVILGCVAGLSGIGGGIYLAPLLLTFRLARPKEAAAMSAGLVVVASVAGLGGRVAAGWSMPWDLFLPLALAVLVAGQLGAWLGSRRLKAGTVRLTFGVLVLLVSARLLSSGWRIVGS